MREGWESRPLGDVLRQIQRPVSVADLDLVPFAGVRWYAEGVYHRDDPLASTVKTKTLNRIVMGDIVYNRMWATKASFGVVGDDAAGCLVTNDFPIFEASEAVLPGFVGLLFQWRAFQTAAAAAATGTTERRRLHEIEFVKIRMPIPPLPDQRRIVDLIGALDDTRAAAQAALSASPYRQMLKALGDLYEPERLEDVVDRAFAGGTPSRQVGSYFDGRIPWLKSGEVENDHIVDSAEHINDVAMRSSSARLVPSGATVVAMYGQGDTKGRAGFVEAPVTTNQAVLALIPNVDRIHSRFLLHAVRSRTESLRSRAVGAAQPNLSKSLVLAETVPVPQDLRDQRRWADLLDAVRRVESDTQDEHLRLQAARSSLLTALLSGEHEIPESYDELMGAVS